MTVSALASSMEFAPSSPIVKSETKSPFQSKGTSKSPLKGNKRKARNSSKRVGTKSVAVENGDALEGLDDKARRAAVRAEAERKLAEFKPGSGKTTEQGDLAFYSDAMQRQREALRWYPDVLVEMGRWWDATLKTDDVNNDMRIEKIEYVSFYSRIFAAFNPDEFTPGEIVKSFQADWERDSKGFSYLSHKRYEDALFSLPDMWCETAEEVEYLDFLVDLFPRVFPDLPTDDEDAEEEDVLGQSTADGGDGGEDSIGKSTGNENGGDDNDDGGGDGNGDCGGDGSDGEDDVNEEEDEFGMTKSEKREIEENYNRVKQVGRPLGHTTEPPPIHSTPPYINLNLNPNLSHLTPYTASCIVISIVISGISCHFLLTNKHPPQTRTRTRAHWNATYKDSTHSTDEGDGRKGGFR